MNATEKLLKEYPENERNLFNANQTLQKNLYTSLMGVAKGDDKEFVESFVSDGFYPYYTKQKCRILFIGKESLGLGCCDYIEVLLNSIRSNDPRGRGSWYSNNRDPFHSKLLYIAYGLNHGYCDCSNMPRASEIGMEQFANEKGISYAFMNFSKFDNPSEIWCADRIRIAKFCELVERTGINWYEMQIELLNPDLIISMNIRSLIERMFKGEVFDNDANSLGIQDVDLGYLPVGDKKIPLINTFHFSCIGESFEDNYYKPIVQSLREYFKKAY